jgi:transposase-like protein
MEKRAKVVYEKCSQKDYSMSFKLGVVQEVESRILSVTGTKRKYGIQWRSTVVNRLRKHDRFIGKIKHHQTCPSQKNSV